MKTIALRLTQQSSRYWHLQLAQALRSDGHQIIVSWHPGGDAGSAPLDLLRSAEARLYRAALNGAAAHAPQSAFSAFPAPAGEADLVLDCTGQSLSGAQAQGQVLQPVYENCLDERALLAPVLKGAPPHAGWRRAADGAILSEGRLALELKHVLSSCLDSVGSRMISLCRKALAVCDTATPAASAPPIRGGTQPAGTARIAGFAARQFAGRIASRLGRRLVGQPSWTVGWRRVGPGAGIVETGAVTPGDFTWLAKDPARFIADPFPVIEDGRTYVFVEELPFSTNKGLLSVFEVGADNQAGPLRPVLERPYHLSYPNVFRAEGSLWMIPETSGNGTIELYRPDPFPHRWVLDTVLVEAIVAADATVFRHDGLWWMMASTSDFGGSSWDSLSLFYADRLRGPWTPHPLNPVLVDVSRARPAGWIVAGKEGLLRPGQDCSSHYGAGLAINRIDRLDRTGYAETLLARPVLPAGVGAHGFHTANRAGDLEVVDALM